MYSKVSIKNFRGIESLEAEGLRRINLILGRNNSGRPRFSRPFYSWVERPTLCFPQRSGSCAGSGREEVIPIRSGDRCSAT